MVTVMVITAAVLAARLECHIHTARRILIEGPEVIRSRRIRERAPAVLADLAAAPQPEPQRAA